MRIRLTLARNELRPPFAFQLFGSAALHFRWTLWCRIPGVPTPSSHRNRHGLAGIRNDEAEAVAVDGYRCFVLHRVSRYEPAKHAVRIASIQGRQRP